MRHFARFTLLAVALAVAAPMLAFGQDTPPPDLGPAVTHPAAPTITPGIPGLDDAPLQFAGVLIQLAQTGRWGAFASLAVFALVWATRKFAVKLPEGKVREALLSKWGGWLLNFALAVAAGFGGVTFVGLPITVMAVVGIIGGAVSYALGAAGLVELTKDLTGKRNQAVQLAGDAAAAAVTDKEAALRTMEKGPQP